MDPECSKKFSPKIFLGEARHDTMPPSISSFRTLECEFPFNFFGIVTTGGSQDFFPIFCSFQKKYAQKEVDFELSSTDFRAEVLLGGHSSGITSQKWECIPTTTIGSQISQLEHHVPNPPCPQLSCHDGIAHFIERKWQNGAHRFFCPIACCGLTRVTGNTWK